MGSYRVLFAVFSTLSLLTLIWTGFKDAMPEWKHYQKEFNRLLQEKIEAKGETMASKPRVEINQMWLPALRRTDRCMTCHLGVENVDFADAPQPYTKHPGKYLEWHPVTKFGCTSCHKGQGLATDFEYAAHTPPDLDVRRWKRLVAWAEKGLDDPTSLYTSVVPQNVEELKQKIEEAEKKEERWEKEFGYHHLEFFHDYMLPAKYIEISCMKCHDSRALEPYAPTIAKARKLITEVHKCRRCHSIPQIPDLPGEPEAPCPDLHGFADKSAHSLDFGSVDATDADSGLPHTGAEIDVLRSIHHDPLEWTVEHFIAPQLFIMTSQMAKLDMSYEDAEALTTFVRGLAKELPERDYVGEKPTIAPNAVLEGSDSMFIPPPIVASAAAGAAPAAPPASGALVPLEAPAGATTPAGATQPASSGDAQPPSTAPSSEAAPGSAPASEGSSPAALEATPAATPVP